MSGEKTQLPTPRKLAEARKKGQFPKSQLALGTAPVLGAVVVAVFLAPLAWSNICTWAARLLSADTSIPLSRALEEALRWLALATAVPTTAALLVGVGIAVAQAGIAVYSEPLRPSLDRLNPFKGLRRLVEKKQLLEIGKGLVLTLLLAAVTTHWLYTQAPSLLSAIRGDGQQSSTELLGLIKGLLLRLVLLLVFLSLGDYLLARRSHTRSLMMSREELEREHKEMEGSPEQKAHRQALQRQLAMGGPARGVQAATALVVNPTHVAVALRYDESECDAPYIVAKGRESDALALRRLALRLKIPIVRDIPLARSLIPYDVGEQIPEELYRAAAAVLRTALDDKQVGAASPLIRGAES